MSVALNYVEGYARFKLKSNINFLEISYGSLKESEFILEFAKDEKFFNSENDILYQKIMNLNVEISKMLYSTIINKKQELK